jgi:hypothetical protein
VWPDLYVTGYPEGGAGSRLFQAYTPVAASFSLRVPPQAKARAYAEAGKRAACGYGRRTSRQVMWP